MKGIVRVNIDGDIDSREEFKKLTRLVKGDDDKAMGMLVRFFRLAQRYWGHGKLIPIEEVEAADLMLCVQARWGFKQGKYIECVESELRFGWYRQRVEASVKGGRPKVCHKPERNPLILPPVLDKNTNTPPKSPRIPDRETPVKCPEAFKTYLSGLLPAKARSEGFALTELLKAGFKEPEVSEAMRHVQRCGTLAKEPCHSPLGYLSKTINDVLIVTEKSKKIIALKTLQEASVKENEVNRQAEDLEYEKALQAFQRAFKTEEDQKAYINDYAAEHSWPVGMPGLRFLVVSHWKKQILSDK